MDITPPSYGVVAGSIPAGGILGSVKKSKEYTKCLFKGDHHNLVFKNNLVFFISLTKP